MKVKNLIKNVEVVKIIGSIDFDVKEIKTESNKITKGSLFVCLKGGKYNGCDYIKQAETFGALCIVTEKELETSLTQIIVSNARKALAIISANYYNNAHKKLKIIGVTGTNGKTTTTHLITSILMENGIKCGLIGTLGIYYGNVYEEPELTTPDPLSLHKTFSNMVKAGVSVVAMEISAHALHFFKTYGLEFEAVVFTNFTQDHLDFFESMESYKMAKLKLFKEYKSKFVITNVDDNVGKEIADLSNNCISYGLENPADIFAIDVKEKEFETSFILNLFDKVYNVKFSMLGLYNVYNVLAASTVSALLGVNIDKIVNGIENLKGVEGRLELVHSSTFNVFIDYAHTPDGLLKSLGTLKNRTKGKLICVFGCGGNRDAKKRKIMGNISGELADFTVITSDNPRFEEPMEIIFEIEKGVLEKTKNYVIVEDRKEAIKYAINLASEKDVILIAGKGSEKYQEIFGIKKYYNDKDTVKELIR